jgi:hypothetical protein
MHMAFVSPMAEMLCALLVFAATDVDAKERAASSKASKQHTVSKKARTSQSANRATPVSLHLRSIDLIRRVALVEVAGLDRPPLGNLFTFTDGRDRHFVAMSVRCEELPSGSRQCELDLPAGYERHRLVSLTLHVRGLHSNTVAVEGDEIETAWSKAESEARTHARIPPAVPAAPMDTAPKGPPPKIPKIDDSIEDEARASTTPPVAVHEEPVDESDEPDEPEGP